MIQRLRVVWVTLATLTICFPSSVWAQNATSTELTSKKLQQLQRDLQQQRQLKQKQINELGRLRQKIQQLSEQQKQTFNRLEDLAANIGTSENELAKVTQQVAEAEQQLAETTSQLKVTEAQVKRLIADIRVLMNAQYRDKSGHLLELLSQSTSLSDLVIRLNYSNRAGQHIVQTTQELKKLSAQLQEQQDQEKAQTAKLKKLKSEREEKLAQLRQRRQEQQVLLAKLKKSEESQRAMQIRTKAKQALTAQSINQLVSGVYKERQRLEAERQRRIEAERRRREAEARRIREAQERARREARRLARIKAERQRRARAAALAREQQALRDRNARLTRQRSQAARAAAPLPRYRGSHGFPLPGGSVAVPYGRGGAQWAVLKGQQGARVVAALPGNVLASTYYASLGWIVLVDNGGGVVTGYFGLQDTYVNVGQRVSLRQSIGAIGGSPVFGQDRMAFQLRQNNVPVAPRF